MLYLPDFKQYSAKVVESAICSNLKEIQQEEEIIFFDEVKNFEVKEPITDVTF